MLLGLLVASAAHADDKLEQMRMRFIERGDVLTVTCAPPSCSLAKLFDSTAFENMSSGFPSTVVLGVAVYPRKGGDPIAVRDVEYSVVYDLWDEQYVVRLDLPNGRKTRKVTYRAEALKMITAVEDLPIARLADMPFEDIYFLRMTVQLNPVSPETLAEVRRWIAQGDNRGGVFFGSFVSVFVNPKVAAADRVLRVRSQPF